MRSSESLAEAIFEQFSIRDSCKLIKRNICFQFLSCRIRSDRKSRPDVEKEFLEYGSVRCAIPVSHIDGVYPAKSPWLPNLAFHKNGK